MPGDNFPGNCSSLHFHDTRTWYTSPVSELSVHIYPVADSFNILIKNNIKMFYILFIVKAFQSRLHSKSVVSLHIQYNRIKHLYKAAEVFLLQIIEVGSWVGIVTFSSSADIQSPLQQITSDAVRQNLVNKLPTIAGGGTNICSGVRTGLQVKYNMEISPGRYGK